MAADHLSHDVIPHWLARRSALRLRVAAACFADADRSSAEREAAAFPPFRPTLMSGRVACLIATPGPAGLLATAIILVDGRPGPALGFWFGDTALLITFGDVLGLRSCLSVYFDLSPRGIARSLKMKRVQQLTALCFS
jgi:hypothetical protein